MRRWLRLVLVLGIGLGIVAPVLLFFAALSFAGARFGWAPMAVSFGAMGALIGWAAVSSHWAQPRRTAIGTLAVLCGLVGIATAHASPPTPGRLRHEIEALIPDGWTLTADSGYGNALCFDYCTSVDRAYEVDGGSRAVVRALALALADRCTLPRPDQSQDTWNCRRGEIDIRISLEAKGASSTIIYITAE